MGAGGVFGAVCFLGLTLLIYRRLTDPRIRATSSVMDITILLLLYAQLILGMSTIFVSAQHLDGGEMLVLAGWAQHLVTLRPDAADLIAEVPLLYKLHILLGLTIFLVFPFSRLVHIWSAPVELCWPALPDRAPARRRQRDAGAVMTTISINDDDDFRTGDRRRNAVPSRTDPRAGLAGSRHRAVDPRPAAATRRRASVSSPRHPSQTRAKKRR